jgi:S1-C subfamily serine protease
VAVTTDAASRATTFTGAMQTLGDLQTQLRRLADDEGASPLADTLLQAARDIGVIQRRLRAAQADQQRRRSDEGVDRPISRRGGSATVSNSDVPGLSLSPVSDDLSDYFGDGSERGLLVLQADAGWSPIRNGDVILSVDGAPVSPSRLRDARDSHQPVRVELLRRRRQMTVTLNGREE